MARGFSPSICNCFYLLVHLTGWRRQLNNKLLWGVARRQDTKINPVSDWDDVTVYKLILSNVLGQLCQEITVQVCVANQIKQVLFYHHNSYEMHIFVSFTKINYIFNCLTWCSVNKTYIIYDLFCCFRPCRTIDTSEPHPCLSIRILSQ